MVYGCTIYPSPITMAASFSNAFAYQVGLTHLKYMTTMVTAVVLLLSQVQVELFFGQLTGFMVILLPDHLRCKLRELFF